MEKEKFMSFKYAYAVVRELAKSQGFYCRILMNMEKMTEEERQEFEEDLAFNKVKTDLDLIFYFEC